MSESNPSPAQPVEAAPASGRSPVYEADPADCCSDCGRIWEAHLETGGACPARMEQSRIVLALVDDCWMAQHFGPRAAEIVEHFGTDTLPTPFRSSYPSAWVKAELEALNPGVVVEVA